MHVVNLLKKNTNCIENSKLSFATKHKTNIILGRWAKNWNANVEIQKIFIDIRCEIITFFFPQQYLSLCVQRSCVSQLKTIEQYVFSSSIYIKHTRVCIKYSHNIRLASVVQHWSRINYNGIFKQYLNIGKK